MLQDERAEQPSVEDSMDKPGIFWWPQKLSQACADAYPVELSAEGEENFVEPFFGTLARVHNRDSGAYPEGGGGSRQDFCPFFARLRSC